MLLIIGWWRARQRTHRGSRPMASRPFRKPKGSLERKRLRRRKQNVLQTLFDPQRRQ